MSYSKASATLFPLLAGKLFTLDPTEYLHLLETLTVIAPIYNLEAIAPFGSTPLINLPRLKPFRLKRLEPLPLSLLLAGLIISSTQTIELDVYQYRQEGYELVILAVHPSMELLTRSSASVSISLDEDKGIKTGFFGHPDDKGVKSFMLIKLPPFPWAGTLRYITKEVQGFAKLDEGEDSGLAFSTVSEMAVLIKVFPSLKFIVLGWKRHTTAMFSLLLEAERSKIRASQEEEIGPELVGMGVEGCVCGEAETLSSVLQEWKDFKKQNPQRLMPYIDIDTIG
ncbi:hypothetical protein FRB90_007402, partial [Tulasnella sp. 427]